MSLFIRTSMRISCLLILVMSLSCATAFDKRGRYHRVRSGESIWAVARAYHIDVQELAEFNNIFNPSKVTPGSRLYIPERPKKSAFKQLPGHVRSGRISTSRARSNYGGGGHHYSKPIQTFRGFFSWPLKGRLTSPFGIRNGRRHDGIDIATRCGRSIRASASGRVVFSGRMRGYGNVILIRHKKDFFTAYAHNTSNRVRKGRMVKKGQVIATVGRTGRATGCHLHFEIRHGQRARNPLFFLPKRK